jgi:DNA replication initiation complex subunit (GINS family)
MSESKSGSVFAAGKAKWLLKNAEKLSEDERALLLAIIALEKDTGRELTPDEQKAIDELSAKIGDFKPDEIMDAVKQMVEAETTRRPVDEWPSAIHKIMVKRKKPE